MNKIFKVVWSKVKHCYVVVSEIAKNTISGGARRCRVRKGALAAALVTTVLGSSFVMPNSAWAAWDSEWNTWRPTDYNDENKNYDDASHGNSYEAMVVLSAASNDDGTSLGIALYRGDKISGYGYGSSTLSDNVEYLHPSVAHAALGELWNKDYAYTKVESSATADFNRVLNQTITQTVVNDIIAMVNGGDNVYVSGQGTNDAPYVINALDTKNESVSLTINESNELVVSVTDADGVSKDADGNLVKHTLSGSINLEDLKEKIDTNTTYTVTEDADRGSNEVGKWNVNEIGKEKPIATIVDTDTKVLSGSVVDGDNGSYGINLVTNERTEDDKEVIVPISGLHDYYTTGVSVDGNNLKFNRNDGSSYALSFVAGGGNSEDGDTYVKISVPNANDEIILDTGSKVSANDGKATQEDPVLENITINGQSYTIAVPGDVLDTNTVTSIVAGNDNIEVEGVATDANGNVSSYKISAKNTYVEDVSVGGVEGNSNAAKVNFTHNDETEGYEVTFVGAGSVNISAEGENVVISAVDTNTTYIVEEPVLTDEDAGNVVKKWNIKSQENGEVAYTNVGTVVDTDTRVTSGRATYTGANGTITLTNNDGSTADIEGLHDYYTTGVSVSGNDVVFDRNDGSSYGINFIAAGGNSEDGDTYVKISVPNANDEIILDTGSKVSANDGKATQEDPVLEDITINGQKYTLGYSWKLGVGGDNGTDDDIVVNSGQTLKLAEGDNVSLAYNNGTITISALVKAEGKYADWQQPATRGGTTNSTTGLPQLSKLTVDGKEYSIPTINEVINPDSDAPLLKAVELNGKEYRIADPAWTVKVANGDAVSSFDVTDGDAVEYVAGSNIVLSAETTKDENGVITGGKIVVTTAKNVVFDSVTVGGKASGNVVINNSGIAMYNQKITGLAAGEADTDAVNVSQLRDVQSSIAANDQHLVVNPDSQDGKYKVNGNTVTLKVQGKDANGGTVYTNVVIDDVASASSVNERFDEVNTKITNIEGEVTNIKSSIENINQNIANAKVEVEAGSNITVEEDEMDGGGKKYTISATDTNTTNKDMEGTGWVAGSDGKATDDLLIKVNDSDGKSVEATIKDVAKASDLKQEIKDMQDADSVLAGAIISNQQDVQNLNAGLNKLGNRMNKVGAGSAALAALHPMDFDPDDKLQFSAGVGHYGGENAAALGAFYRPTEKVMFSVAGTMGNGEDMVNAGVTFALDKPNNVSNSRVAMAREIQDLRQQVAALTMLVMQMASRDNAALAGVAMFPDVPENHWAYDYIEGLQKQGIIEGYPDGNFGGDRSMTRYEFAAMLYRALEKGFPVDSRLLNEFNAELGRIRVDRIKGADNDAKKVERVRVNADVDRDDYGSKIVQVKAGAQKSVLKTKKDENHLVLVLLISTF